MIVERIGRVKYNIKNSERQSLLGNHFKTPINPPPLGVIHNWDSFKIGIKAGFETKIIFGIYLNLKYKTTSRGCFYWETILFNQRKLFSLKSENINFFSKYKTQKNGISLNLVSSLFLNCQIEKVDKLKCIHTLSSMENHVIGMVQMVP